MVLKKHNTLAYAVLSSLEREQETQHTDLRCCQLSGEKTRHAIASHLNMILECQPTSQTFMIHTGWGQPHGLHSGIPTAHFGPQPGVVCSTTSVPDPLGFVCTPVCALTEVKEVPVDIKTKWTAQSAPLELTWSQGSEFGTFGSLPVRECCFSACC